VPVVASDIAPYRRWIKHGVNGFLAKNGYDWVRYLARLTGDKDLRLAMGREAKKQAVKRDIANNIGNWIKAYNLEKERIYANT
jgi:glycosyltransferase involved in cell wall biosynthesis